MTNCITKERGGATKYIAKINGVASEWEIVQLQEMRPSEHVRSMASLINDGLAGW